MKFVSVQIKNYKSFDESPKLALAPGRNLVVGQNNSGKTAFLEALSLAFGLDPHRTSLRGRGYPLADVSQNTIEFELTGTELQKIVLAASGNLHLPFPSNRPHNEENVQAWLRELFSRPQITFLSCKYHNTISPPQYPGFDLGTPLGNAVQAVITPTPMRSELIVRGHATGDDKQFAAYITQKFGEAVYFFNAERVTLASCAVGASRVLSGNARNLAEVLHNLQDSHSVFGEFVELVHRVLPAIRQLSVRNISGNLVEIFVSNYEDRRRDDLFVSLQRSGSGVGQVLAILYVLFSSSDPRTVIIDEPNSFLHPGAVRRLLEVIKEARNHQFVISTHSPDVISGSEPERLFLTRWVNTHTEIEVADGSKIATARAALGEVGARLSDVYGADRILWVEGNTEERCFPEVIRTLIPGHASVGTAVLGVPATGDLQSRRKDLVLQIYRKLSGGSTLIPPAVAFIFDRDSLSDVEVGSCHRDSGGIINFLPRRCYENYLLVPEAILLVLNREEVDQKTVTLEQINDWLSRNGTDRKFFRNTDVCEVGTAEWYRTVDAALLLGRLFADLRTVSFTKTVHSFKLTTEVLMLHPAEFNDLVYLLTQVLGRA